MSGRVSCGRAGAWHSGHVVAVADVGPLLALPPPAFPRAACPSSSLGTLAVRPRASPYHRGPSVPEQTALKPLPVAGLSDEEDQKPVRLPLRVPVELQPRNNHAWARVQSLAQNPRLR